ncbi:MAG: hypothetical protein QMD14_01225 [Candidatus Aenigmarchaeota archaeon]|nr:hypothetical protein [Candidatus Aenigmarchaeota archaeon]
MVGGISLRFLLPFIVLIFLFVFLLHKTIGTEPIGGIVIRVIVAPTIRANYYFINVTLGPVQSFYIAWENSGSVDCDVLPRIIFLNSSNISVFTAWIKEGALAPGDESDWIFYSVLLPGNYTMFIKVLYCKELYEFGPYSVEVKNYTEPIRGILEIVANETHENYVELTLKANETLRDIVVTPVGYPVAWTFTQARVDKIEAGKEVKVKLFYKPTIWRETTVRVKAITMDGKYEVEKEIFLVKRMALYEKIMNFLISITKHFRQFTKV